MAIAEPATSHPSAPSTCHGCWMSDEYEPGLVSVIMPSYNRAAIIGEAIDSVVAQQYRPIELLVVDDGSTDDTADVVEQIRDKLSRDYKLRLRYIRQENAGAAAARNHALRLCRGEFLQFLDSDDCLESEKLSRQVAMMRQEPACDVVYGDWLMGADRPTARRLNRSSEPDMLAALLRGRWVPCFSYLLRRRVAIAAGPWDEQLIVNDDFDYFVRTALAEARFLHGPGLTGLYRWHQADRLSRQSVSNFARANYQVLRKVVGGLEDRRRLSDERRRAVADCYWSQCARCVYVDRELFEAGLRELRTVCPDWQPRRGRERLAMRRFGEVRVAQLEQDVAGIQAVLRRSAKRLLGYQLRAWIIQRRNKSVAKRGVVQ